MIEISPAALEFIQKSSAQQFNDPEQADMDNFGLRIAVYPDKKNSCFRYGLGFDNKKPEDESFNINGVKILIAKEQTELLDEATIDYVQMDDGQMNLIVLNPNDPSYVPPKKDKTLKN